jgi:chemotaxis signal transduction protein
VSKSAWAQGSAVSATSPRAQGIRCGGLSVALPYSWARQVVDSFHLSRVPNAPPWLAGAANVDGRIVAVLDLAAWAQPEAALLDTDAAQRPRLLLGGTGTATLALRFQGLPALLMAEPQPGRTAQAAARAALPDRLHAYLSGVAMASSADEAWPLLDMDSFTRDRAGELAH